MKKTLTLAVMLAFTTISSAQIKMQVNGDIALGDHYGQTPIQELDVFHRMFVRQNPRNGTPGYQYTGAGFVTYTNGTNQDPIMEPQWGNTYWLGRPGFQFWRVYSNQFYANSVLITSDARLKTNLKPVSNSLDRILSLQPYTYDYKFSPDEKVSEAINKRTEDAAKNHVGFKAQDLQIEYPNLVVYDNENDRYSLNYIGLIPEIVAAMKEQNNVIIDLKSELEMVKGNCCNSTTPNNEKGNVSGGESYTESQSTLEQNQPNPFYQQTEIKYYLSDGVVHAGLYIYDFNGKQIDRFVLSEKGHQSITIQKNKLNAGMYYYSLIADGKEIATKKMILTD